MIIQMFIEDGSFNVSGYLSFLMVAFFAFAYHEFAHAWVADRLGDPTPRANGRLTLNPIPHIDATGFILLALFGFGWASTPVSPHLLRGNPRQSYAMVAVAGPLANLVMALLFALAFRLSIMLSLNIDWVYTFLNIGVWLNCLLMIFNLLPVPPLDGFSILLGILPSEMAYQLAPLRQYGMLVFLGIFFILPMLNIHLFGGIIGYSFTIARFLTGI
ncbi:MAG: site-2 protease family protein [Chloroflexi bacterium]|nr:site-2 protease family protein [Chloroflexota bacterium]MDA0245932.1 site-2 protease family protein [Chloroflexota bacterium]